MMAGKSPGLKFIQGESRMETDKTLARAREIMRRLIEPRCDRPSLVSNIACDIGAEIVVGIRQPGEDLNSVELAKLFQTSRTPTREALMLLEKEGLVDIPSRRRPRVSCFDLENIREIYRVRAALFEHIAGDIVQKASEEEIASLNPLLAEMELACVAKDINEYAWANIDFFNRVTHISHNKTVKSILDSLLIRTLPLRRLSLSHPGRLERSLADHTLLVRAYEDRDVNLAAALLKSNNIKALAVLEAHLSKTGHSTGCVKTAGLV